MIPNTSTTTTNASSSSQENEDKSRSIFIAIYDDDEDENKQMQLRKQRSVIKYLFCGFLLLFVFIAGFNLFTNANTKSNLMSNENHNGERNLLPARYDGEDGEELTKQCSQKDEMEQDCAHTINKGTVQKWQWDQGYCNCCAKKHCATQQYRIAKKGIPLSVAAAALRYWAEHAQAAEIRREPSQSATAAPSAAPDFISQLAAPIPMGILLILLCLLAILKVQFIKYQVGDVCSERR